jgi:hypothetical protein
MAALLKKLIENNLIQSGLASVARARATAENPKVIHRLEARRFLCRPVPVPVG